MAKKNSNSKKVATKNATSAKQTKSAEKKQTRSVNKKANESTSKEQLKEVNKNASTQKVVIHRDLKYKYPKGCIDQIERKKYRQKIRRKLNALKVKLAEAGPKEKKGIRQQIDAHMEKYMN